MFNPSTAKNKRINKVRYDPALTGACRQDCQVEFDLPDLQGCKEVTDSDPGALQTTDHVAPHPGPGTPPRALQRDTGMGDQPLRPRERDTRDPAQGRRATGADPSRVHAQSRRTAPSHSFVASPAGRAVISHANAATQSLTSAEQSGAAADARISLLSAGVYVSRDFRESLARSEKAARKALSICAHRRAQRLVRLRTGSSTSPASCLGTWNQS